MSRRMSVWRRVGPAMSGTDPRDAVTHATPADCPKCCGTGCRLGPDGCTCITCNESGPRASSAEDNGSQGRCSMTASLGPASPDCPECEGSGWRIDDEAPADFLPEWCLCRDRSVAACAERPTEGASNGREAQA